MSVSPPADVTGAGPFRPEVEIDYPGFKAALAEGDYTQGTIQALKSGLKGASALSFAVMQRRTAMPSVTNTLLRLFHLGQPVTEKEIADAFEPPLLAQLLDAGIVQPSGMRLRAAGELQSRGELLIFSDFFKPGEGKPLPPDYVMGLSPSTLMLAALTPRRSVEGALDMGTGGGFHALLAAVHAERVVATDISPRALNFAAMNARLNDISNVEFRLGSFFEPVEGERFELVVANPPFVISPESRMIFRDGGLRGDGVSEHTARSISAHLEEGGSAVMLANWYHSTEEDWAERPKSWTGGNGCDVRWMKFDDYDPWTYAASWLRQEEEEERDVPAAGRMLDEWARYYESAGINRIALGALVMRKRSGVVNWLRCDDIPIDTSLNACGEQIERIFDAEDLLHDLVDERELLDMRFKLHPAHRLEQRLIARDGEWSLESNMLHITSGMDFCAQIDMPTMQFLTGLDGTRTVREATVPIAEGLGRNFEDVVPICLGMTKRFLRVGLLTPA